jgi:hypothetical protein
MGGSGMYEHSVHAGMGHVQGPPNTLAMATGQGPFGTLGMGGMFTVLKVRSGLRGGTDPGWYADERAPRARRVDTETMPQQQDVNGER